MRARLQLTRRWVPEASALGQDITYQCAMHSSVIYAYLPNEPHTSKGMVQAEPDLTLAVIVCPPGWRLSHLWHHGVVQVHPVNCADEL